MHIAGTSYTITTFTVQTHDLIVRVLFHDTINKIKIMRYAFEKIDTINYLLFYGRDVKAINKLRIFRFPRSGLYKVCN